MSRRATKRPAAALAGLLACLAALALAAPAAAQLHPSPPSHCTVPGGPGTSAMIASVTSTATTIVVVPFSGTRDAASTVYWCAAGGSATNNVFSTGGSDITITGLEADTDHWVLRDSGYVGKSDWHYIKTKQATGTGPTITISGGSAVTEGTAAAFTLTASEAPSSDLTVNLTVSEAAGSDFVAAADEGSKTATISSGSTTASYSVTTQSDRVDEPNGSVTVTVGTGTGYTVGTTSSAMVTVNDDDPTAPCAASGSDFWDESTMAVSSTSSSITASIPSTSNQNFFELCKTGLTAIQSTSPALGPSNPTHTFSSLDAGTQYWVRARSVGRGTSQWVAISTQASTNSAPVFTGQPTTATVAENSAGGTAVATVAATDADSDTLTYSLDSASDAVFEIRSTGGITVKSGATLDHEATSSYATTVTAHDGTVGTDHGITISVTDVLEPPPAPATPTVAGASRTSVTVSWTAPSVTGRPAITDYDVQYRKSGVIAWTDASFDGTTLTTTITGLEIGTTYEAQVRAKNDEGAGDWSATGSGSTDANNAPVFTGQPTTATVAENSGGGTAVATVAATDADGDTLSYSLDSASAAVFEISSTGAITVKSGAALDHEATSSYATTVTADDGTDTTDHGIAISVSDENEPPPAPAAPTVTGASTTSVTVTWTAPSVTGRPAISDYDVQYRQQGVMAWTDASFDGTTLTTTIAGLEAGTTYQAQVRAKNAEGTGGWSATGSGSTNTPTNNAPVFTNQPTTATVAENSAGGTAVATVAATDADSDTLTYSLDSASDAVFEIRSTGGITVKSGATLDHEATSSYATTVTAHDGTVGTDHGITISVTDVLEPPPAPATPTVAGASRTSVTVSWTAPSVTGRPAISDYDVQYRKSGVMAWTDASFNGTTLTATIAGLEAGTTYQAQVRATNAEGTGNWSATGSGSTNANNAPVFTGQPTTAEVAENSAGGTAVATVAATDADGDTLGYSLDSASGAVFEISSAGAITVKNNAALDHEATPSYAATVTADDGTATTDHSIAISVTDENEPPPAPAQPTVTGVSASSVKVTWTAPSAAGRPAISDYDVQYRKSGVMAWTDATFDGTTLTTTIAGLEAGTTYQAQVRATNAEGTGGWSATGSGSTNTPTNNAPVFTNQPTTATVAENSAGGTAVATVAATDADSDTLTYSLDSASDAVFEIRSTGGITVKSGATLDHEATSSYATTVTAHDGTVGTDHGITISVTDVLEPPPAPGAPTVSALSTTSLAVSWTPPTVSGPPPVASYQVRYRRQGDADWQVILSTGPSTTIAGLEAGTTYQVQVRASNAEGYSDWSSGSGTTNSATNNAPRFTNQPTTAQVAEHSPGGTRVVTVAATDADGDTLAYSLDPTSDAVFAISASGVITVRAGARLDYETTPSYRTVVMASDGSATATHTVTISVTDVDERPAVPTATVSGNRVTLRFSAALDTASGPPPAAAFRVTADGRDVEVLAVQFGSLVLTLAEDVSDGQQVRVIYDPGRAAGSPLRYSDGTAVEAFGLPARRAAGGGDTEAPRPDPLPLQLALWTDKPGYLAGETVRLYRSLAPHDDRGRYRAFAYLERAGGGERRYLAPLGPGGRLRAEAADARGVPARASLPRQLAAADRELAWEGPAPGPGLWRFVLELRPGAAEEQVEEFAEPVRARRAWAGFAVAERGRLLNVRGFDREIRDDLTLRSDTLHYLRHQLFVRAGATLTIEPGTVVQAWGRQAAIIVEPGGKIVAEGTRQAPVVLTCSEPAGRRAPGCWGGLRILGRAPVTRLQGTAPGVLPAERAAYGGREPEDSSGALRYVRVEFAGASPDPEAPAAAVGLYGAGSGTVLDHVQARASLGDGFAFHGGSAACEHCVASGSGRAGLSWRRGWRGGASHLYVQHGRGGGDGLSGGHDEHGHDLEPRSLPTLSNVTLVHAVPYGRRERRGVALRLADGSGVQAESLVAARFGGGAVRAAGRSRLLFGEGESSVRGALLWLNGPPQVPSFLADGVEFRARNPQLRDVRDFANPDPRPKLSLDAVMYVLDVLGHDREPYIGAFGWRENWLEEWTVFGPESVYDLRQRAEGDN